MLILVFDDQKKYCCLPRSGFRHSIGSAIEGNGAKPSSNEAKFFPIDISPSNKEIVHLKERYEDIGMKKQLKSYTEKVIDEYVKNSKRNSINCDKDLMWFVKLEVYRYYANKDKELQE